MEGGRTDAPAACPTPRRRLRVRRQRPLPESWLVQYGHLQTYRRLRPDDWPQLREFFPEGNRLGLWCFHQRQSRAKGRLSPDRANRLDAIRFPWDGRYRWYRSYRTLVEFRAKHPNRWPTCREEWPAGNMIGAWCHSQRVMAKRHQLALGKVDLLNLISFKWVSTYHEAVARHLGRR